MASVLIMMSTAHFEGWLGASARLGHTAMMSRVVITSALVSSLTREDTLYLGTVRPDGSLWLVLALDDPEPGASWCAGSVNRMPITDISEHRHRLRLTTGKGLPTEATDYDAAPMHPFGLAPQDATLLAELRSDRSPPAEQLLPPPPEPRTKSTKPRARTKAASVSREAPAAKPAPSKKAPEKTELLGLLIEGAIAQIEEIIDSIAEDPKRMLKPPKWRPSYGLRGEFTESVQSIFSGGIDATEACRMLGAELAPFVDGKALALVLGAQAKKVKSAAEFYPELADAFAIRAIDDLARALVALATDQPALVPATCAALVPLLDQGKERVSAMLAAR